ncbi:DUF86 domain-containing protein [Pantanalinema rosaneae CENA516]|uniref:HepT-like ribonuclease domain-containing protein n=1 Tax=Pantanalinema rosaneae TaxID=1620701 RepID=UPI003D6FE803
MLRNIRLYLEDIVTGCTKIQHYTQAFSFDEFVADQRTYDAVLLNLKIVGEAVKNIPVEIRNTAPTIEWRKIAGLRDIVAHTYFQIDPEIIWDIVQTKIAPLQTAIEQLLQTEFDHT